MNLWPLLSKLFKALFGKSSLLDSSNPLINLHFLQALFFGPKNERRKKEKEK